MKKYLLLLIGATLWIAIPSKTYAAPFVTNFGNGSINMGTTVPLQYNGFGTGFARIQTSTSSNDIEQWQLINKSTGTSAAGCVFFGNDKTVYNNIGASSSYYGGTCFAGSQYNLPGFNGIKQNGVALFATDGPVTIGSGSTQAASSSVYFQAGSGLDASYDAILQGGTGNFGVGTSSPGTRLGVGGDGYFAGRVTVNNLVSTSSALSSSFAGSLGVGTTTPGSRLTVASASVVPLLIDQTGGSHNLINFTSNSTSRGGIGYTTLGSAGLGFWNPALSNVDFIVTGTGNVGIGTTSPLSYFHAAGASKKYLFDGTNVSHFSLNPSTATAGNIAILWGPTGSTPTTGQLTFEPQTSYGSRGTSAGASPIVTFNSNTSNVGVGTTTPRNGSGLEVYAASSNTTITTFGTPSISITNSNTTASNLASLSLGGVNTLGSVVSGARISAVLSDHTAASEDADLAILTVAAGTISEKMRVTNTGGVGIGTTTPSQFTQINSTSANLPSSSAIMPLGHLGLTSSSVTNVALMLGLAGAGQGVPNGLSWIQAQHQWSASTNFPLGLNPNGGNVGIGTTTPVANFQVTNASANATTTTETGKPGQSKGTCDKKYRYDGTAIYISYDNLNAQVISTTPCATVTGF